MSASNRLSRLREAQHLSGKQLAEELGVHPRTIHRWETGHTSIPEKHWARLSHLFGVSVAYLLGLDDGNGANGEGRNENAA